MKKLFLYILFIFCFAKSFSQTIVNRANAVSTVQDMRLMAGLNLFIPRYTDTSSVVGGIDSCGAVIYTYLNNMVWVRGCSPKRWISIGNRFGHINEDVLADGNRRFNFASNKMYLDSGSLILNAEVFPPSDTAFAVRKGIIDLLRVNATDGITYINSINSQTFTTYQNFASFAGGYVQHSGGVINLAYQQPFNITRYSPNVNPLYGVFIDNDTTGATGMDSSLYYPLRINYRFHDDNISRLKFSVNGAGTIYSANYPHGGNQNQILVNYNGEISYRSLAEITAAVGGGGGGGTLQNVGLGYRWAQVGTTNVKTAFGGYGITLDSTTNTSALTITWDSTKAYPRLWNPAGYITDTNLHLSYLYPLYAADDTTLAIDTGVGRSTTSMWIPTIHYVDSVRIRANNGDTIINGKIGLGGTLIRPTRISASENDFTLDSLANAYLRTKATKRILISSTTTANDSAFMYIERTTGIAGKNQASIGVHDESSGTNADLFAKNITGGTGGIPEMTIRNQSLRFVYSLDLDTLRAKILAASELPTYKFSYINAYPDSVVIAHGSGSSSSYNSAIKISEGGADQYARDSLIWRSANRQTAISIYPDSMALWQRTGDYYVYNLVRETDTTGLDLMVLTRSTNEWKRIPSNLVGGASGIDAVLAVGQALTANRTIAIGTFGLTISGTPASNEVLTVQSNNSFAAGNFISSGGNALVGQTTSANALWGVTTQAAAALLQTNYSSTNSTQSVLRLKRTTGTAANGIGGTIEYEVEASDGSSYRSTSLESFWSNVTVGSRVSQFNITGVNAAVDEYYANFQTGGIVRVNNLADTLSTKAYARSVGGGGGGSSLFPTTGTGTATGNVVGDIASNQVMIISTSFPDGLLKITNTVVEIGDIDLGNPLIRLDPGTNTITHIGDINVFTISTTTGTTTSSGIVETANSLTSGTAHYIASSTQTSGNELQLVGTSTALAANNELLDISLSGAIGTNAITATGARISVTNTNGTSGTNVGLDITASGATTDNFAITAAGSIKITSANIAQTTTSSALSITANSLTTGTAEYISSSSITTGALLSLVTTGTVAAAGNTGFNINRSGANGTSSITVTGSTISVTNTGTTNTNVGINVTASGATNNYAAVFTGRVGIGTTTPSAGDLYITNASTATVTIINSGFNASAGIQIQAVSGKPLDLRYITARTQMEWINGGSTTIWSMNYDSHNQGFDMSSTAPTSKIEIGAGTTTANTAPLEFNTGPVETVARAGVFEYTTPQLFFTNGGAQRQEIPQIQQARVSTQYDNTTTTLGTVTGLTTTVVAGKTYRFEAILYTTSNVGGGVKAAIAGTATATAIVYEGFTISAGTITQTRATALATAVGAVTAVTAAYVHITGTITVNAAGTLLVQAAANVAVGTTSVLVGSTFVITEML